MNEEKSWEDKFLESLPPTKDCQMIELNKIYCENCLVTMAGMEDASIDLTVTSPPYDNLRTYKGYSFDFESIAKELFRVTKQGGVVVWVVGDATVKGSETGTSFRQALYFKECGFNLHDTMIYQKDGQGAVGSNRSYWQNFEYMFIFSKDKLKTFNPINDRKNVGVAGIRVTVQGRRNIDGSLKAERSIISKEFGRRFNTWKYRGSNLGSKLGHPAIFPEQLANDHIISWSNEQDIVYDPFMGSGTTAKMAMLNNRQFIGSEISEEYCAITRKRIRLK